MRLWQKRIIGILVFTIIVVILGLSVSARRLEQGAGSVMRQTTPTRRPNETADARLIHQECLAPYETTSIWNVPLDWNKAKIHPQSDLMMDAFFAGRNWIGSDATQFSPNVYFVDNRTPLVPVALWDKRSFRDAVDDAKVVFGSQGDTVLMPLPADAKPAPGTDNQLLLVNLDTGEEWGLNKGKIEADGTWSAGGIYRYHINNSGIPPKGFGQRGAGIGQFAGIIRPCEIERGYIGHAVTLGYDFPCVPEVCKLNGWPEAIPPFTKTDGRGTSLYDIPEGARLVIRPEISRDEIMEACSEMQGCVIWALTMQEFGGFIVDNSGHPKTYGEGDATAHWDRSVWSSEMLRNIPPDWYAVLDWNYPATSEVH